MLFKNGNSFFSQRITLFSVKADCWTSLEVKSQERVHPVCKIIAIQLMLQIQIVSLKEIQEAKNDHLSTIL